MKCKCGNTRFRTVCKAEGVFKCRVCGIRYQEGVAISGPEPSPEHPRPIVGRKPVIRKVKSPPRPHIPVQRKVLPVPEVQVPHGLPMEAVPAPKSFLGTLASGIMSRVSRMFGGG